MASVDRLRTASEGRVLPQRHQPRTGRAPLNRWAARKRLVDSTFFRTYDSRTLQVQLRRHASEVLSGHRSLGRPERRSRTGMPAKAFRTWACA